MQITSKDCLGEELIILRSNLILWNAKQPAVQIPSSALVHLCWYFRWGQNLSEKPLGNSLCAVPKAGTSGRPGTSEGGHTCHHALLKYSTYFLGEILLEKFLPASS